MKINQKKLRQLINQHKAITKLIANTKITRTKDQKAFDKHQVTGKIIAMVLAEFKCEKCGSEEKLTYHHMITKINKDYVPAHKYYSQRRYFFNICILCRDCHNMINGRPGKKDHSLSEENINKLKKEFCMEEKDAKKKKQDTLSSMQGDTDKQRSKASI